ncbi:MAG: AsmA family protein, partial [Bacteroidota bacterium]
MPEKSKRSIWIKLVIILMVIVLGVAGAGLFMKFHYKDIVESKIKTELNNRIIPEIYTNIDFTVFKTFPDASVVFYNTTVADPLRKDSILLKAEKIYFRFNLMDIIRKEYRLSRIDIITGQLNLFVDKDGNENFDIIRQKTDSVKEALSLELEKVLLRDMRITYDDHKSDNYISAEAERATAKGKFGEEDFNLETAGNFHLEKYRIEKNVLAENDELIVDLVMKVSPSAGKFTLGSGQIEFNSVPLEVSGAVDYHKEQLMNVKLMSPALDLNKIMDDLPDDIADDLAPYKFAGKPFINIQLSGAYGGNANPHIEAS